MTGRVVGVPVALAAIVGWFLPDLLPAWWLWLPAALLVGIAFGSAGYRFDRRRQLARAQDVATLERAEAVLAGLTTGLDDELPPLPPAIPMSMRDPAFQRRIARLDLLAETINASGPEGEPCKRCGHKWHCLTECEHAATTARGAHERLLAQPLVADRRFTLTTHCQHGHVATHWLGRITTDHVERICRFERCAATWLEKT